MVGAGPGGLASALLLAARGIKVVLFERDDVVGGRTQTLATPEGHRFDLGPTFFLYPKVLAQIFAACGERLEDHVELKRLDPQYRLVFEGAGELSATPDVAKLTAEIAKIAPDDAKHVARFFAHGRTKLKLFEPVLEQAFHRRRSLVSRAMLSALPKLQPMTTVDGELRHFLRIPDGRHRSSLGLLGCLALLATSGCACAANVEVTVSGVTPGGGNVLASLCHGGLDRTTCLHGSRRPAEASVISIIFADVEPGRYAALAFQDNAGSGELKRSAMGRPLEPYGLSNGAGRSHRPTFEQASFGVGTAGARIAVKLRSPAAP